MGSNGISWEYMGVNGLLPRFYGNNWTFLCIHEEATKEITADPSRGPYLLTLKILRKRWHWVAYKPGSVSASAVDDYSSRTAVTSRLERPTRAAAPETRPDLAVLQLDHAAPTWSCSRWGLPCRPRYRVTRCALTTPFHPYHTE